MSGLVADTTSSLSRLVTGVGATFRPYKSNEAGRSSGVGVEGFDPCVGQVICSFYYIFFGLL